MNFEFVLGCEIKGLWYFPLSLHFSGFEKSRARALLVECLEKSGFGRLEFLLNPNQFGIPNSRLRYYLIAKRGSDFPTRFEVDWPDLASFITRFTGICKEPGDEMPPNLVTPNSRPSRIVRRRLSRTLLWCWTDRRIIRGRRRRRFAIISIVTGLGEVEELLRVEWPDLVEFFWRNLLNLVTLSTSRRPTNEGCGGFVPERFRVAEIRRGQRPIFCKNSNRSNRICTKAVHSI